MIEGPPSPLGWTEFDPPRELVPLNDVRQHVQGMRCWCDPEVDETMTVIHRACDRREDYIQGRRKPH